MSAERNTAAMVNQGEFKNKVPPSEPLTTKGHKPGVLVGNDAAPEFSAQTFPPGTAPAEHTFQPNTKSEIPGQAANPDASTRTDPLDFPGATSGSVHSANQFGNPLPGETSQERHGQHKNRSGVEGRVTGGYAGVETGDGSVDSKVRGLGADLEGRAGELKGHKGASGATEGGNDWTGAEELPPTSSEELASERR